MLPSIVASELQTSLRRFLQATFPMTTPGFRRADDRTPVDDLLEDASRLFRGPYLSLGLPFRPADPAEPLPFQRLKCPFPPHDHQMRAFRRLCGEAPQSTLVATGTGSGKTEAFLFPLLDHCATRTGRGVKAIVVYPMNALATDQARRIARLVQEHEELRARVSVGLFVGDATSETESGMTADSVITSKDTLREQPPDILLTNYKMLDFLLMRPRDQGLWQFNEPGVLRYLVVDELHTFDGAQGTDLACLLRRLRYRLAPEGDIACVGTSDTIGGAEAADALRDYAQRVFATAFDTDSVILERRMSPPEFVATSATAEAAGSELVPGGWPDMGRPQTRRTLNPENHRTAADYLRAQARLWLGVAPALDSGDATERAAAALELGRQLMVHPAFAPLLERAGKPIELQYIQAEWAQRFGIGERDARLLLDSLLALISAARRSVGKQQVPLVEVRLQLWLRELRRMVASCAPEPALEFADDLRGQGEVLHLPVVHCRECHAAGWATVRRPDEGQIGRAHV